MFLLQVFKRDYTALPDETMLQNILSWANGSATEPPQLYAHLLEKRGGLYYIQDRDFTTFLAQYYDRSQKRITLTSTLASLHCLRCSLCY